MGRLHDLAREYEARRYPEARRLDLHADGPATARERALRWIQSYAHEEPGQDLLLIVERGRSRGRPPTAVRREVEELLEQLRGRLVEWWQVFGDGSLALRIAREPRLHALPAAPPADQGEGRTLETASSAPIAAETDIPPELLATAERVAELRRNREGISVRLVDVVLRRVWVEAQAKAMEERIGFGEALSGIERRERAWILDEDPEES